MRAHPRRTQTVHDIPGHISLRFRAGGRLIRAALSFILFTGWVCPGQSGGVAEYDVKATFLYDFAKFVDWPKTAVGSDQSPFVLCVVGADPFGAMLDSTVRGQRIDRHEISIRRVSSSGDLTGCRIAFISRSESKHLPAILDGLKGSSTLVVGDSQDFAKRGGGIQLYLEDNAVRFSINIDSVRRAHLAISSNVLALATIVHDAAAGRAN
jgi:hypothetical protein